MKRQLLAGSALALLMVAAPARATAPAGPQAGSIESLRAGPILAQDETAPAEEELPRKQQQAPAEAQPDNPPAAEPAPEPEAAPQPQPEAAPEPVPQPEPQAEPQPEAQPEPQPEGTPAPEPEPAPQAEPQPQPEAAPEPAPQPDAEPAPEPEAQPPAEPAPEPAPTPEAEPTAPAEQTPEAPAGQEVPGTAPAEPETQPSPTPAPEATPAQPSEAEPAPDQPAAEPGDGAGTATQPATPPAATGEQPADGAAPADAGTAEGQPENAAPVLDSAKEVPAQPADGAAGTQPAAPAEPPAPPPADDRAAQEQAQPAEIQAVTVEQGTRIAEPPPAIVETRPEGVNVVREIGDRVVIEIDNTIIVESSDRPRMTRNAREVYYEELPRGRTREVVIRQDGTRVVTVRNRYGDIVRRSRIAPDGREYVLVYVDDQYYDRLDEWRDPGLDLPPMRLDVPASEYVFVGDEDEDSEAYYEFLERPPVERVERLYSVDEVKRSARIRDKVPRIELDTLTFEFGSAAVGEDQVSRLQSVAEAIERLLERNPAETFLIEGHTDAVGSDVANLALSDRRAEAVADALTNVFDIPPENIATQGYGERYLKIKTGEQERLNRRVVIRRITPLVAPVASAN